jgi:hypothetical protein
VDTEEEGLDEEAVVLGGPFVAAAFFASRICCRAGTLGGGPPPSFPGDPDFGENPMGPKNVNASASSFTQIVGISLVLRFFVEGSSVVWAASPMEFRFFFVSRFSNATVKFSALRVTQYEWKLE